MRKIKLIIGMLLFSLVMFSCRQAKEKESENANAEMENLDKDAVSEKPDGADGGGAHDVHDTSDYN